MTDHRIGYTSHKLTEFMDGKIDDVIDALLDDEEKRGSRKRHRHERGRGLSHGRLLLAGISDTPGRDATLLLSFVLGKPSEFVHLHPRLL